MIKLGKYEIIEELGKGGFGIVYKARDPALDLFRAIKVMHSALLTDPTFVARFKQEAKIAAKLEHPNLVPVYDFGEAEGRFFLVMKFMPGGSLESRLKDTGKIKYDQAVTIMSDVTAGLSFAHKKGIIHRDLKPGNILFDAQDCARIGDLGFAKSMIASEKSNLSMSGGLIGTPAYMAPEIWRGQHACLASDLYSLGCIIYEMFTGEVLFTGESPADVMTKHILNGPDIPDSWPDQVRAFLLKALSKNPDDRFKTPVAFFEAFSTLKEQSHSNDSKVRKGPKPVPSIRTRLPVKPLQAPEVRKISVRPDVQKIAVNQPDSPSAVNISKKRSVPPKKKPKLTLLWIFLSLLALFMCAVFMILFFLPFWDSIF